MPCISGLVFCRNPLGLLHMTFDVAVGLDHFCPLPSRPHDRAGLFGAASPSIEREKVN